MVCEAVVELIVLPQEVVGFNPRCWKIAFFLCLLVWSLNIPDETKEMVHQVSGFSQISMVLTTKGPQSFVNYNGTNLVRHMGPNYLKEGMVVT